jgi:hypothetical protein
LGPVMASGLSAGRSICTRSQLHGRVWHWQTSAATGWKPWSCVDFAAWEAGAGSESETGRNRGRSRRGRTPCSEFGRLPDAGRTPERCWRLELAGRQSSLDRCIAGRRPKGERKVPVMTNRDEPWLPALPLPSSPPGLSSILRVR